MPRLGHFLFEAYTVCMKNDLLIKKSKTQTYDHFHIPSSRFLRMPSRIVRKSPILRGKHEKLSNKTPRLVEESKTKSKKNLTIFCVTHRNTII